MRASRSRTCDATNLFTATPDEFALGLACALLTARDRLSLRLVCRRFNIRCIARGGAAAAAAEMLCAVEEAGRLWVACCSEQERGWVSRGERVSWLGLMHAVVLLRVPLVFGRSHADVTLSEGGAVATKGVYGGSWRAAASKVVMRSGRHFAQFTVVKGAYTNFGKICRAGTSREGRTRRERTATASTTCTLHGQRRDMLPRSHRLGGDTGREGPGRSYRYAARPRPGQHDRLEERRKARRDGGRGAERSALLGGGAGLRRRQRRHRQRRRSWRRRQHGKRRAQAREPVWCRGGSLRRMLDVFAMSVATGCGIL